MRALRYRPDSRTFAIDPRTPEPRPAPGQALIRVTLAAGDPDDLRAYPDATAPFTPGKQFVGVVEAVNSTQHKDLLHRRVVACPAIPCAACDLCRGGTPAHCRARKTLGSPALDGALAEKLAVPARALIPVPDELDDESALLALPLAGAIHAARHARLDRKSFVTIVGDNLIALLCAQVMTKHNATVRLLGNNAARMEICEKWGVRQRPLREAGRRADQDVVIECTGAEQGVSAALGLLKPRATLILITPPAAPIHFDLRAVIDDEIEIVGSRGGDSAANIAEALALLARGDVAVTGLAPTRLALEHAADPAPTPALRTAIAA